MEDKKKNFKQCDICDLEATLLCLECLNNYYCESCYKFIHDKKAKGNHKKEKIDYYLPIEARCPEHTNIPLNLFCIDEKGNYFNLKYYFIAYRALLL